MNKRQIMLAAWELFREKYHYPTTSFKSIGRACFGWCLSEAYRRAREAARIAAIPVEIKQARVADLHRARELAAFMANYRQAQGRIAEIDRELSALVAA
jgi:hypothetical protein